MFRACQLGHPWSRGPPGIRTDRTSDSFVLFGSRDSEFVTAFIFRMSGVPPNEREPNFVAEELGIQTLPEFNILDRLPLPSIAPSPVVFFSSWEATPSLPWRRSCYRSRPRPGSDA